MEYFMLVLGLIIGSLVVLIYYRCVTISGVLRIDHSDPDKDIYQINLNSLDDLAKKKRVVLKVDNNAKLNSIRKNNKPYYEEQ